MEVERTVSDFGKRLFKERRSLLGGFRQLSAVLDSWAGRPLEHSQLVRDLAGGRRRKLTENMRSDPGIFDFVKWLRVGEEGCPHAEAGQGKAEGALLEARVAGHHAGYQQPGPGAANLEALDRGCYKKMGVINL